jgi:hypothetical protein
MVSTAAVGRPGLPPLFISITASMVCQNIPPDGTLTVPIVPAIF